MRDINSVENDAIPGQLCTLSDGRQAGRRALVGVDFAVDTGIYRLAGPSEVPIPLIAGISGRFLDDPPAGAPH